MTIIVYMYCLVLSNTVTLMIIILALLINVVAYAGGLMSSGVTSKKFLT